MGRIYSDELATTDSLTLEQQIAIHFSSNCYPPIPQFMVGVAVEAINAYNESDGSRIISLPSGVTFRDSYEVTAFEAIENLRLDSWCNDYENEME